ncbi:hypothetical protein BCB4264_A3538 [Bacillus cereus B4264]|uniref:Uncharacterized protein n=1 Tax=Bacillus cereus (strain B4264) TaxID=405532 RepID=B7H8S4_BACC4|nr:hypothetical protein BCB4264_A3538 [Bacillus cereus B4264]
MSPPLYKINFSHAPIDVRSATTLPFGSNKTYFPLLLVFKAYVYNSPVGINSNFSHSLTALRFAIIFPEGSAETYCKFAACIATVQLPFYFKGLNNCDHICLNLHNFFLSYSLKILFFVVNRPDWYSLCKRKDGIFNSTPPFFEIKNI